MYDYLESLYADFFQVVLNTLQAIGEIFVIAGIGIIAGKVGILTPQSNKIYSNVSKKDHRIETFFFKKRYCDETPINFSFISSKKDYMNGERRKFCDFFNR